VTTALRHEWLVRADARRQVIVQTLQSAGDHVVDPTTVLPWLFSALGVHAVLVGLLVPAGGSAYTPEPTRRGALRFTAPRRGQMKA